MEETAFDSARDADFEYVFYRMAVESIAERPADVELVFWIAQHTDDDKCAQNSGYEGRYSDTFDPHVNDENQNGITADIDDIHADGNLHGYRRIAHHSKQSRSGVIQRDKGGRKLRR